MNEKEKIYFQVAEGLANCQQVELQLKYYLAGVFKVIKKYAGAHLHIGIDEKHFEDMSLERLIQNFKLYSKDESLIKRLSKFKEKRNNLAHKSLLKVEDPSGEIDLTEASELDDQVRQLITEAQDLSWDLYEAGGSIWVKLWFDEMKANQPEVATP
jgi:hypothetical protein